jgi:hypothetical protein
VSDPRQAGHGGSRPTPLVRPFPDVPVPCARGKIVFPGRRGVRRTCMTVVGCDVIALKERLAPVSKSGLRTCLEGIDTTADPGDERQEFQDRDGHTDNTENQPCSGRDSTVAFGVPEPSPLTPNPIALMPTARDRKDKITIPAGPDDSTEVPVPASRRLTASSCSCF